MGVEAVPELPDVPEVLVDPALSDEPDDIPGEEPGVDRVAASDDPDDDDPVVPEEPDDEPDVYPVVPAGPDAPEDPVVPDDPGERPMFEQAASTKVQARGNIHLVIKNSFKVVAKIKQCLPESHAILPARVLVEIINCHKFNLPPALSATFDMEHIHEVL